MSQPSTKVHSGLSPACRIAPFTIERYDQAYALWQSCEGIGLSGADSRIAIEGFLERNPGMSFVAADGTAVVGTILAGHDGRRGYIHHLAVDPSCRRRGLGTQLVDSSLAVLGRAGIQKCHLFIYRDNAAGIRFWESRGWNPRAELALISRTLAPATGVEG